MKALLKQVLILLNLIRLWPTLLLLVLSRSDAPLRADIRRWCAVMFHESPRGMGWLLHRHMFLMVFYKEYRNLVYLRLPASRCYSWMMPRLGSLFLDVPELGPGCYIQHGFSSMISAERIGANFWLNQNVDIGYSNDFDRPTIGNDVTVRPGAKIIGKLNIGDGATVGLNTVVTGNVPAGATMFGVPGYVIWRKETKE